MRNISKTLLAVALGSFISGNALASDQGSGKITFKGVIIDAPCNIAPDSIDKEIELGQFTTAVMNVNKNPRRYRLISTWKTASLTLQMKPQHPSPKWT